MLSAATVPAARNRRRSAALHNVTQDRSHTIAQHNTTQHALGRQPPIDPPTAIAAALHSQMSSESAYAAQPAAAASSTMQPVAPIDFSGAIQSHVTEHGLGTSSEAPVPVAAALTGRAHQRFDGDRRLVCGAVSFRVDSFPAADASSSSSSVTTRLRVLLVQAKKKHEWIFAKGGWEQFESACACAKREVLEESGVDGVVLASLEPVEFSSAKKGKPSRLYPFLLQITTVYSDWAEKSRARRWVDFEEVASVLGRPETRQVWAAAVARLKQMGFSDAQGRAVFLQPPSSPPSIDEPRVPEGTNTAGGVSAAASPAAAAAAPSAASSAVSSAV